MTEERFVRIHVNALAGMEYLAEGMMSIAAHGLFFREGVGIGCSFAQLIKLEELRELVKKGKLSQEKVDKKINKIIQNNGWAKSVKRDGNSVTVTKSAEAGVREGEFKCHIMRGMLAELYEVRDNVMYYCKETKCSADECEFVLESSPKEVDTSIGTGYAGIVKRILRRVD